MDDNAVQSCLNDAHLPLNYFRRLGHGALQFLPSQMERAAIAHYCALGGAWHVPGIASTEGLRAFVGCTD